MIALICREEIELVTSITRRGVQGRGSHLSVVEFSCPSVTLLMEEIGLSTSFLAEIFGMWMISYSAPPAHAAVAIGGVGVGATVDRGASRGQVLPSPLGHEDHDGDHHGRHQDEAGNGDADGKAPL